MRELFFLAVLFALSCSPIEKREKQKESQITMKSTSNSRDTMILVIEKNDSLIFNKSQFSWIMKDHPEFSSEISNDPDFLYYCNKSHFESEAGRDNYYKLYAYFLKQKNGVDKYKQQRDTIINILRGINSLFQQLENGGTYFGHQYHRILGYAEYSVYLLSGYYEESNAFYGFIPQKEAYLKSLRQLVKDRTKVDSVNPDNRKIKNAKGLDKVIDHIDMLISNNFYLRQAQRFHHKYY